MIVVKTELEVGVNPIYITRQRINDIQNPALGLLPVLSESGIISLADRTLSYVYHSELSGLCLCSTSIWTVIESNFYERVRMCRLEPKVWPAGVPVPGLGKKQPV